jgi:hypothetical protein
MKVFRSTRLILLALFVALLPAVSYARVFISVEIAPPPLPVYEQPLCPEPGWMWQPGYWAYDYDNGGYYWVPGTWVPAPYPGALWTPGYWGWNEGFYAWHPGFWGQHVGYYGGVNYGFGYFGIGFIGGAWRGSVFSYNAAFMHVDRGRFHDVYMDRGGMGPHSVMMNSRVAFSGGPGGIRHDPTRDERMADRDRHMTATSFQTQHENAAMHDRAAFFNNNHGRPNSMAVARPMNGGGQQQRPSGGNFGSPAQQQRGGYTQQMNRSNPQMQQQGAPQQRYGAQSNTQPQQNRPQQQQNTQQQQRFGSQQQPQQSRPQQQNAPQQQQQRVGGQQQSRPAQQSHESNSAPRQEPNGQGRDH